MQVWKLGKFRIPITSNYLRLAYLEIRQVQNSKNLQLSEVGILGN
ncbi:MAG: hypothetical protein ACE5KT_06145 [Methanosarcinales archaeon]